MSASTTQRQIRNVTRQAVDARNSRSGIIEKPKSAAGEWKRMFDIEVSGAGLTVLANKADLVGVSLRGVQKLPSAGSGFTWDSGAKKWTATLSESKYVFLKFARATSAVSLEMDASPTFSTPDDYEYHYLWYVGFSGGVIDRGACVDLRDMVRVEGIA